MPEDKADRLDEQLGPHFELDERRTIEHSMFLNREEAAQLVRMGPSAWHVDEQAVAERLALLPDPLTVTASVTLSRYVLPPSRPRPLDSPRLTAQGCPHASRRRVHSL